MSRRLCYLAFLGIALATHSGCNTGPWPCGNTWCDSSCGEFWWHEWFSHKPSCCDPCDDCGEFVGPHTKYVGENGYASHGGGAMMDGMSDGVYDSSPMEPTPAEELPMGNAGMRTFYNEFGQQVSYQDSPPQRPMNRGPYRDSAPPRRKAAPKRAAYRMGGPRPVPPQTRY